MDTERMLDVRCRMLVKPRFRARTNQHPKSNIQHPTRRDLLIGGACGLAFGQLWALQDGEELVALSGYAPGYRVDVQPNNPRLKSFDLRRLTSWKTPEPEFYEFHQGSAPAVDGGKWRLRVGGAVERPAEFSLEDLQRRPDQRDAAVTLECS